MGKRYTSQHFRADIYDLIGRLREERALLQKQFDEVTRDIEAFERLYKELQQEPEAVRRYKEGVSTTVICHDLKIGAGTLYRMLRACGVPPNRHRKEGD